MDSGVVVGERFVVERIIGAGAMGAVYRARDRQRDGAPVALKVLHEGTDADRFLREGRVLDVDASSRGDGACSAGKVG